MYIIQTGRLEPGRYRHIVAQAINKALLFAVLLITSACLKIVQLVLQS